MDAAEGMKQTIAERKKLTDEKVKLVRHVHLNLDEIRQKRREEQRRQD